MRICLLIVRFLFLLLLHPRSELMGNDAVTLRLSVGECVLFHSCVC